MEPDLKEKVQKRGEAKAPVTPPKKTLERKGRVTEEQAKDVVPGRAVAKGDKILEKNINKGRYILCQDLTKPDQWEPVP